MDYQKQSLAKGNEAMIKLYPLPSPHNHAWYYSWLDLPGMPFLKTREQYQEHVYPTRIKAVLEKLRTHKPQLVLMYGMTNINGLKKSIQAFSPNVTFKAIKAVKQQIPQHHRTDIDGTTLLLTTQIPALRHNRVETGFDWEEFGRSLKANGQST